MNQTQEVETAAFGITDSRDGHVLSYNLSLLKRLYTCHQPAQSGFLILITKADIKLGNGAP